MEVQSERKELQKYLSPLQAWALSIGCAVGWGAFVMPGSTFLPLAGPIGTAIGIVVGAVLMLIIGMNYHYLINKYPSAGGVMTYTAHAFGFDHGLLSAWFLMLVYIAIMWANATAIVLVVRNIFGGLLQWGFHYQLVGYDIYLGEILLTLGVILVFGGVCMFSKRLAVVVQTVMAFVLVGGVLICAFFVLVNRGGLSNLSPAFAPVHAEHVVQVIQIVVLAPWAFVGFESISNSAEAFSFSHRKSIWIMLVSLICGTACYALLAMIAAADTPEGYVSWVAYVKDLGNREGLASIPVFYVVNKAMGQNGLMLLGMTLVAGIVTGLVGNIIAASRMIYAMAREGILPDWLGRLDKKENPVNAVRLLIVISLFVPFVGRSAIGWIVDVNTIGALIAYGYVSMAACKLATEEHKPVIRVCGLIGVSCSALFFLYFMVPNIWTVSRMASESYLILIGWSILGFLLFREVYEKDTDNRFGKSTVAWLALLLMIFFTSLLWFRETTQEATHRVLVELNDYNQAELKEHGVKLDRVELMDMEYYLQGKMEEVNRNVARDSALQMVVIVVALIIMLYIYRTMMRRQSEVEVQRIQAEESSRAKSSFLSNMSHDIRTPMNAIIGYTTLAEKEEGIPPKVREYLEKITASSGHLLALINDILDLSRIESGKMELEIKKANLIRVFDDVRDMFSAQMQEKGIHYTVTTEDVTDQIVLCDVNRINRMLLNLISNAFKFTPKGGSVMVSLRETGSLGQSASYEISVKDTGMGMSPEFAATVFDAYSREKTAADIQGTGLGMAITKSIVELMGGEISVISEQRLGTEFIIRVSFELAEADPVEMAEYAGAETEADFSGLKLLLVDDNMVNREIASLILRDVGFAIEMAEDGKIAYEKVAASQPGDFQLVLMDVQMPVMNGYEATRAIRQLEDPGLAQIPVIAMTANAFVEDIQKAKDAGMNGHIAKPIDVGQMIAEIKKHCSGKEPEGKQEGKQ